MFKRNEFGEELNAFYPLFSHRVRFESGGVGGMGSNVPYLGGSGSYIPTDPAIAEAARIEAARQAAVYAERAAQAEKARIAVAEQAREQARKEGARQQRREIASAKASVERMQGTTQKAGIVISKSHVLDERSRMANAPVKKEKEEQVPKKYREYTKPELTESTGLTEEEYNQYQALLHEIAAEIIKNSVTAGYYSGGVAGVISDEEAEYKAEQQLLSEQNLSPEMIAHLEKQGIYQDKRLTSPVAIKVREVVKQQKAENVKKLMEKYPGAWEVEPQNGQRAWFLPEGDYEVDDWYKHMEDVQKWQADGSPKGKEPKMAKMVRRIRGAQVTEDGNVSTPNHGSSTPDSNFIWQFAHLGHLKDTGQFRPKTLGQLSPAEQAKIKALQATFPELRSWGVEVYEGVGTAEVNPIPKWFMDTYGIHPYAISLIEDPIVRESLKSEFEVEMAYWICSRPGGSMGAGNAGKRGGNPSTLVGSNLSTAQLAGLAGGAAAAAAAASARGISSVQQYQAEHKAVLDAAVFTGQMTQKEADSLVKGWDTIKGTPNLSPSTKILGFNQTDPKSSVPLSLELMTEGLWAANIAKKGGDERYGIANNPNADIASALAGMGYTKAASQIPGAVPTKDGGYRMRTIQDATDSMTNINSMILQQELSPKELLAINTEEAKEKSQWLNNRNREQNEKAMAEYNLAVAEGKTVSKPTLLPTNVEITAAQLMESKHYTPKLDANGKVIEGEYNQSIPLTMVWGIVGKGKREDGTVVDKYGYIYNYSPNEKGVMVRTPQSSYISAIGQPKVIAVWNVNNTSKNDRSILIVDPDAYKDGRLPDTHNWMTWGEFSDAVASKRVAIPSYFEAEANKYVNAFRASQPQDIQNLVDGIIKEGTKGGVTTYRNIEDIIGALEKHVKGINGLKEGERYTFEGAEVDLSTGKPVFKDVIKTKAEALAYLKQMFTIPETKTVTDTTDYTGIQNLYKITEQVLADSKDKLKSIVPTRWNLDFYKVVQDNTKGKDTDWKAVTAWAIKVVADAQSGAKPMAGAPASIRGDVGTIDYAPTTEGAGAVSPITPSVDTQAAVPTSITPSSSKAVSITRRADGTILAVMKNNQAYVIKPDGTWTKYNTVADEKRGSSYGVCTNGSCKLSDSKAANAIIADIEKSGGLRPTVTQPISMVPFTTAVSADTSIKPPAQKTEVIKDGLGNFIVKYVLNGDGYRLKYDASGKFKGFDYDLKNTGNWLPLTANNVDLKNKAVICTASSCQDMSQGIKPGMEWVESQFHLNKTLNVGVLDASTFTTTPSRVVPIIDLPSPAQVNPTDTKPISPELFQEQKQALQSEIGVNDVYGGTTNDGKILTLPFQKYVSLDTMTKFLFDTGGFAQVDRWYAGMNQVTEKQQQLLHDMNVNGFIDASRDQINRWFNTQNYNAILEKADPIKYANWLRNNNILTDDIESRLSAANYLPEAVNQVMQLIPKDKWLSDAQFKAIVNDGKAMTAYSSGVGKDDPRCKYMVNDYALAVQPDIGNKGWFEKTGKIAELKVARYEEGAMGRAMQITGLSKPFYDAQQTFLGNKINIGDEQVALRDIWDNAIIISPLTLPVSNKDKGQIVDNTRKQIAKYTSYEQLYDWMSKSPRISGIPKDVQDMYDQYNAEVAVGAVGILKMFADIPLMLVRSQVDVSEGKYGEAASSLALAGMGLVTWPLMSTADIMQKFGRGDIARGAGTTVGTVISVAIGPHEIMKGSRKAINVIDPTTVTSRAHAVQVTVGSGWNKDVGHAAIRDAFETAQKLIDAYYEKGEKIPSQVRVPTSAGIVTIKISPEARVFPVPVTDHTTSKMGLIDSLRKEGKVKLVAPSELEKPSALYVTGVGGAGAALEFGMKVAEGAEPYTVSIIQSPKDIANVPFEVRNKLWWDKKMQGRWAMVEEFEEGKLGGTYLMPVAKYFGRDEIVEWESTHPEGQTIRVPSKDMLPSYVKWDRIDKDGKVIPSSDQLTPSVREIPYSYIEAEYEVRDAKGNVVIPAGGKIKRYWVVTDEGAQWIKDNNINLPNALDTYKMEGMAAIDTIKALPYTRISTRLATDLDTVTTRSPFYSAERGIEVVALKDDWRDDYELRPDEPNPVTGEKGGLVVRYPEKYYPERESPLQPFKNPKLNPFGEGGVGDKTRTGQSVIPIDYKNKRILLGHAYADPLPRGESAHFMEVPPQVFNRNLRRNVGQKYLTKHTPDELIDYKVVMNKKQTAGYAIKSDGELTNLFNNDISGEGAVMVVDALRRGATKLNAFDGKLVAFYKQFGFKEVGRVKSTQKGIPDTVNMEYSGTRNPTTIINSIKSSAGKSPIWTKNALDVFSKESAPRTVWSNFGGAVDPFEARTFVEAANHSVRHEAGYNVPLGKLEFIGINRGKRKDFSPAGAQVWLADVSGMGEFNLRHPEFNKGMPEVDAARWWYPEKGEEVWLDVEQYHDIAKVAKLHPELGIDMSKVKKYVGDENYSRKALLDTEDIGFADRRPETLNEIRQMGEARRLERGNIAVSKVPLPISTLLYGSKKVKEVGVATQSSTVKKMEDVGISNASAMVSKIENGFATEAEIREVGKKTGASEQVINDEISRHQSIQEERVKAVGDESILQKFRDAGIDNPQGMKDKIDNATATENEIRDLGSKLGLSIDIVQAEIIRQQQIRDYRSSIDVVNTPTQKMILTRDKNGVEVYEEDKLFYEKPDGTRVQVDLTIKDGKISHDAIPTVIDGKEVWLHNFKDTEGNTYFQVNRDKLVVEKVAQPSIETAPKTEILTIADMATSIEGVANSMPDAFIDSSQKQQMIVKTKALLDSNDVKGMQDWYIRVNYIKSKQHSMAIGENIQSALIEMEIPVEIGKEFSGHGIAKGDDLTSLVNILDNGISAEKEFYTMPLRGAEEAAGAFGAARPFEHGSFIVLGEKGKVLSNVEDASINHTNKIKYVIVNNWYYDAMPILQERYPNVEFIRADNAPKRLTQIVQGRVPSIETAPKIEPTIESEIIQVNEPTKPAGIPEYTEWYEALQGYKQGVRPESIWEVYPEEVANRLNKLVTTGLGSTNPALYNRGISALMGRLSLDEYKQFVKDAVKELFNEDASNELVREYGRSYIALRDKIALGLGKQFLPYYVDHTQLWMNVDAMKKSGISMDKIKQVTSGLMDSREYEAIMRGVLKENIPQQARDLISGERFERLIQSAVNDYNDYRNKVRDADITLESADNIREMVDEWGITPIEEAMNVVSEKIQKTSALIDRAIKIPELHDMALAAKEGRLGKEQFKEFIKKAELSTGFIVSLPTSKIPYLPPNKVMQTVEQIGWRMNGLSNRVNDMVYLLGKNVEPTLKQAEKIARDIKRFSNNLASGSRDFFTGYSGKFVTIRNLQDSIGVILARSNDLYEAVASKAWDKATENARILKTILAGYGDKLATFKQVLDVAGYGIYTATKGKVAEAALSVRNSLSYVNDGIARVNRMIASQTQKTWDKVQPRIVGMVDGLSARIEDASGKLNDLGTVIDSVARARLESSIAEARSKLDVLKTEVGATVGDKWVEGRAKMLNITEDLNRNVVPVLDGVVKNIRDKAGVLQAGIERFGKDTYLTIADATQKLSDNINQVYQVVSKQTAETWGKSKARVATSIDGLHAQLKEYENTVSEFKGVLDSGLQARLGDTLSEARNSLDALSSAVLSTTKAKWVEQGSNLINTMESLNRNVSPILTEVGQFAKQKAMAVAVGVQEISDKTLQSLRQVGSTISTEAQTITNAIKLQTVDTWNKFAADAQIKIDSIRSNIAVYESLMSEISTVVDSGTRDRISNTLSGLKSQVDDLNIKISTPIKEFTEAQRAELVGIGEGIAKSTGEIGDAINNASAMVKLKAGELNQVAREKVITPLIDGATKLSADIVALNVIVGRHVKGAIDISLSEIEQRISVIKDQTNEMMRVVDEMANITGNSILADNIRERLVENLDNVNSLAKSLRESVGYKVSDVSLSMADKLSNSNAKLIDIMNDMRQAGEALSGKVGRTVDSVLESIQTNWDNVSYELNEVGRFVKEAKVWSDVATVVQARMDNINAILGETKATSKWLGDQISSEAYARYNEQIYKLDKAYAELSTAIKSLEGKVGDKLTQAQGAAVLAYERVKVALMDVADTYRNYGVDIRKLQGLGTEKARLQMERLRDVTVDNVYDYIQEKTAVERMVKKQRNEVLRKIDPQLLQRIRERRALPSDIIEIATRLGEPESSIKAEFDRHGYIYGGLRSKYTAPEYVRLALVEGVGRYNRIPKELLDKLDDARYNGKDVQNIEAMNEIADTYGVMLHQSKYGDVPLPIELTDSRVVRYLAESKGEIFTVEGRKLRDKVDSLTNEGLFKDTYFRGLDELRNSMEKMDLGILTPERYAEVVKDAVYELYGAEVPLEKITQLVDTYKQYRKNIERGDANRWSSGVKGIETKLSDLMDKVAKGEATDIEIARLIEEVYPEYHNGRRISKKDMPAYVAELRARAMQDRGGRAIDTLRDMQQSRDAYESLMPPYRPTIPIAYRTYNRVEESIPFAEAYDRVMPLDREMIIGERGGVPIERDMTARVTNIIRDGVGRDIPDRPVLRTIPDRPPVRVPPDRPPLRTPPDRPPTRTPPTYPPTYPPTGGIPTKPSLITPTEKKRTWESLTREEKLASIVWKQGFWFYALPPGYLQKDLINSSKPFAGTKIHTGPKSAYKSVAQVKGIQLPDRIDIDLGIMDLTFMRDKDGKDVKIFYRADPLQKTTGQGPSNMPETLTHRTRRVVTQVSTVG